MYRHGVGDGVVEEDATDAQHDEPVTGLLDVGDDVAREQGGGSVAADRIGQDVQELASGKRIKGGEGLVEQEDRRSRAQRQGKGDLGLLTA